MSTSTAAGPSGVVGEVAPPPLDPTSEILRVEDLTVRFPTDDGMVNAVRGVSYVLHPREVLGIVGESGSGKSVSSMAVMGLLPRSAKVEGRILFRGDDVLKMRADQQRSLRGRKIGMIFQDAMTALNPVLTIGSQLAEAVRSHEHISTGAALVRAQEMLDLVGIPQAKARLKNYPHEFSGGMRQRAMIAMAVINRPDVIFADEPTTALDVTVQAQILDTLLEVKDEVDAAIVFITHDLGVIASVADRVLVMYAGKPVETAGRRRDLHRAAHAVHRGAAGLHADGRPHRRAAPPDPGHAALAHQPADRLPVPAALPDLGRPLRDRGTAAVRDRPPRPPGGLPPLGRRRRLRRRDRDVPGQAGRDASG